MKVLLLFCRRVQNIASAIRVLLTLSLFSPAVPHALTDLKITSLCDTGQTNVRNLNLVRHLRVIGIIYIADRMQASMSQTFHLARSLTRIIISPGSTKFGTSVKEMGTTGWDRNISRSPPVVRYG